MDKDTPPPTPPPLDPVEVKYLAVKAERDQLLVDSHDQFAREEQLLLPYIARLEQLQQARAAVNQTISRHNHTLNTLYELLPKEAQQRIRPEPTPTEPAGGRKRTPRGKAAPPSTKRP
jgi:hypothetical protein